MSEMLTWWNILFWVGIVIISLIGIYLFFIFLLWLSFAMIAYSGLSAKILSNGLEIYSKRKGIVNFYSWDEIAYIQTTFKAPVFYPQLVLINGETIDLKNTNLMEFEAKIKEYKPETFLGYKEEET